LKHLVIPDPHAHPEYDNDRFTALSRFILAEKPDVILCIGDFADMPSLSSYDRGTKGFEGRRYKRDVEAVTDAQARLVNPIRKYIERRRKGPSERYSPRFVMCLGNHEDRISRAVNSQPELDGAIGIHDLQFEHFGWEVIPFQSPIVIDGIAYCHYFASGVAGRPISGENIGKTLVAKNLMSSIQGHSHIFDHSERTRADGQKLFGMSVGCYSHPDMKEGWNTATEHMWWRGVVILEEVDGLGYYDDIRAVTMRKILRDYL